MTVCAFIYRTLEGNLYTEEAKKNLFDIKRGNWLAKSIDNLKYG